MVSDQVTRGDASSPHFMLGAQADEAQAQSPHRAAAKHRWVVASGGVFVRPHVWFRRNLVIPGRSDAGPFTISIADVSRLVVSQIMSSQRDAADFWPEKTFRTTRGKAFNSHRGSDGSRKPLRGLHDV